MSTAEGDCLDDGADARRRNQGGGKEGEMGRAGEKGPCTALHFWIGSSSVTGPSFTEIREETEREGGRKGGPEEGGERRSRS